MRYGDNCIAKSQEMSGPRGRVSHSPIHTGLYWRCSFRIVGYREIDHCKGRRIRTSWTFHAGPDQDLLTLVIRAGVSGHGPPWEARDSDSSAVLPVERTRMA